MEDSQRPLVGHEDGVENHDRTIDANEGHWCISTLKDIARNGDIFRLLSGSCLLGLKWRAVIRDTRAAANIDASPAVIDKSVIQDLDSGARTFDLNSNVPTILEMALLHQTIVTSDEVDRTVAPIQNFASNDVEVVDPSHFEAICSLLRTITHLQIAKRNMMSGLFSNAAIVDVDSVHRWTNDR